MPKKLELAGKRFGRLLVVEELAKSGGRCMWKCLCDCGDFCDIRVDLLTRKKAISCGCSRRRYEPDVGILLKFFRKGFYQDGDLSFDDYVRLTHSNCFYCNAEPEIKRAFFYKRNITYKYNGIDRINSSFPHNNNNCITCCFPCNHAKNNQSVIDFYNSIQSRYNILHNKNVCDIKIDIPDKKYIDEIIKSNGLIDDNGKNTKIFSRYWGAYRRYNDGNLDFNSFYYLCIQNCFYCGKAPSNILRLVKKHNGKAVLTGETLYYSGLDRVDNSLKHDINNCVSSCKYCNSAKRTYTFDVFKDWVIRVYNNFSYEKVLFLENYVHNDV
jgi:5-methylcytosine-specific restriction endonuclease McrA